MPQRAHPSGQSEGRIAQPPVLTQAQGPQPRFWCRGNQSFRLLARRLVFSPFSANQNRNVHFWVGPNSSRPTPPTTKQPHVHLPSRSFEHPSTYLIFWICDSCYLFFFRSLFCPPIIHIRILAFPHSHPRPDTAPGRSAPAGSPPSLCLRFE